MAEKAFKIINGIEEEVSASEEECKLYRQNRKAIKYCCPLEPNGVKCRAEMIINSGAVFSKKGRMISKAPYFSTAKGAKHAPGCMNTPENDSIITVISKNIAELDLEELYCRFLNMKEHKKREVEKGPHSGETGETKDKGNTNERDNDPDIRVVKPNHLEQVYIVLINAPQDSRIYNNMPSGEILINCRNFEKVRNGALDISGLRLVVAEKCPNKKVRKEFAGEDGDGNFTIVLQDPYISQNGHRVFYLMHLHEPTDDEAWESRKKLIDRIKTYEGLWLIFGNWKRVHRDGFENYTIYETDMPSQRFIDILRHTDAEQMLRRDQ